MTFIAFFVVVSQVLSSTCSLVIECVEREHGRMAASGLRCESAEQGAVLLDAPASVGVLGSLDCVAQAERKVRGGNRRVSVKLPDGQAYGIDVLDVRHCARGRTEASRLRCYLGAARQSKWK